MDPMMMTLAVALAATAAPSTSPEEMQEVGKHASLRLVSELVDLPFGDEDDDLNDDVVSKRRPRYRRTTPAEEVQLQEDLIQIFLQAGDMASALGLRVQLAGRYPQSCIREAFYLVYPGKG